MGTEEGWRKSNIDCWRDDELGGNAVDDDAEEEEEEEEEEEDPETNIPFTIVGTTASRR